MADRYWVGGSGNWDATSTANWAASSGGTAGASAPTSADNVIFDAASNTGTNPFTVTVTGTSSAPAVCADFSTGGAGGALDGAMTLSLGATAALDIYGSMTLPATNFTWSGTAGSELTFRATTTGKTVTTNGVLIQTTGTNFNGAGGEWTLGSAYTGVQIRVLQGTFNTGNFNISGTLFNTVSTNTRTVTLGSSTCTFSGASPFDASTTTGLTFNANTSQITCSAATTTFTGGGLTFYNVTFSSAASGTVTIFGANTFSNNLTFTSRSATGIRIVSLGGDQTVSSGTLTFGTANTAVRRIQVFSSSVGTQRTITLNGTLATLADCDFRDIKAAGTAGTWTGTRIGDCKNNSGITFDASKTVYWNLAGTQDWSSVGWATTNNGAPAVNNFPLAQDTAVFTEAGAAGTVGFNTGWNVGTIQMADGVSNRTTAFTLTSTASPNIYGSVTLFSNLTVTGTNTLQVNGQGVTQVFTSAGVSITQSITVNAPSGTFQLADNLTNTGTAFTLTAGTLDLSSGNRTLTCVTFSSSNSNTRSIAFGTGQIDVTGNNATVWSSGTATNFSYTGTSKVRFTYSGSTGARTISINSTSGTESNAFNLSVTAGADTFTFTSGGTASCKDLDFTGFAGTLSSAASGRTIYGNLKISSGMTVSSGAGTITFGATSGTQQVTTNGVTLDLPITVNAPGATVQLQDNLTIGSSRTFTLTAGTLDLTGNSGNWTLSTGLFSSSNSNTRSIAFGTGNITVTGNNATIWTNATATNLSYTGTPTINSTYSGAIGIRAIQAASTTGGTESNALNFVFNAGTDEITFGSGSSVKNLTLTGWSGSLLSANMTVYGNYTLSSGTVSTSASTLTFAATSGTQQITTAGVTLDRPVTINAPGATVKLIDALILGSTRTLTLTAGTFDSDGYAVSTGLFNGSGTTARTLSMGASTWTITGAGTAWNLTDTTNLTLNTDTSTISMTGSSAHTFAGGSQTYYNLNVGGTGDLTIEGNNTFNEISDSVDGSTVYFTAGSTTTTSAFTVDGASGNLISFRSTTPGSVWYLVQSAGSVGITYVDIQDSDASGGATFQCVNGVNSGNNTGWQFINSGVSGGNFLLFF